MINSLDRINKVIRKLVGRTMGRNKLGDYMFQRGFTLDDITNVSSVTDRYVFRRVNGEINEYAYIDFQDISWNIIRIMGCTIEIDKFGGV